MYERDELDIIYPDFHEPEADGRRTIQLHVDEYISTPDPFTECLTFNTTKRPFDDKQVRQALVLARDRHP